MKSEFPIKGDDRVISTRGKASFTMEVTVQGMQNTALLAKLLFGDQYEAYFAFSQLYRPGWIWNGQAV